MDHEKHPAMARGDQVRPRTVNATLQAWIAAHYNNDCAFALALVAGVVAVVIVILALIGVEARAVSFDRAAALAAMSLGYGVVQLDVTIVNTALNSIGASLGGGVSSRGRRS